MGATIKGITIEIGGDTTKLDKAISGVNKQSRSLQVELKNVNKLLKLDPKNTELLAQKQEILKESIAATSEKLDVLKEAEAQVQEQFQKGEASEEQYRLIKREVIKCAQELDDLKESASQADKAMGELQTATKDTGEDLGKTKEKAAEFKEDLKDMGEKAKAAGVAAGTGLLAAATYATKFETDCDQALNTLITRTGAAADETDELEESMLNLYKENYGEDINDVAIALSEVATQTNQTGEELEETTKHALLMRDVFDIDLNEGIRGVNAMMKEFGISADEAYNLMAQGAQKGLNQNGDLADQLAEYSVYYADMGFTAEETFNMIANGAAEGTFQIDYLNDAVKEFGIRVKDGTADETFTQLGLSAEDLKIKFNEGGASAQEAFSQVNAALFACDDEVQRNSMGVALYGTKWEDLGEDAILSLTNTQGEISSTKDALSEINEQKYDDLGSQFTELGRTLQTDLVAPVGESLAPTVSEVLETVKTHLPEVKEVVLGVVEKVKEFIGFLSGHGSQIIAIIAGIAAGMLAWNVVTMIQGVVAAIKAWQLTTEGLTLAQKLLNLVMAANPIGIIITIIAALIAALVTLWTTNEDFRNKVIEIWNAVKEVAMNVFGWIANFFTVTLPAAIQAAIAWFQGLWDGIVAIFQGVGQWFNDRFTEAWNFIVGIFQGIGSWFLERYNDVTAAFQAIGQWFNDRFTEAWNFIVGIFQAIGQWFVDRYNDVTAAFSAIGTWFSTKFTEAYNNVTAAFSAIGSWFQEKYNAVTSVFSGIGTWFSTKFTEAYNNVTAAFSGIGAFFSGIWEDIKRTFTTIGTNIGNAIGGAFKSAMNSALSTVEGAINGGIGLINGAIGVINKIPGVNIGTIGTVSLPRLAKGGTLKEGQAIVAEAGPELIQMVNGEAIVTPLTGTATNTRVDHNKKGKVAAAGGVTFNQQNVFNSPKALSATEISRKNRTATRSMVLQLARG